MDASARERVKRFASDEKTAKAVYELLLQAFLRPRSHDVYMLAASKLAVDYLNEAWRDVESSKNDDGESKGTGQVGI